MLNNVEEFINHTGELMRLCYDSTYSVYYLQNLSNIPRERNMCLEVIDNPKQAITILRQQHKVKINSIENTLPTCVIDKPEGLFNDGLRFNLFVETGFYKEFMKDDEPKPNMDILLVQALDTMFESEADRHSFYTIICKYLETGEPIAEPIKICDGRARLIPLKTLLAKILGSPHCVTFNRQYSISMVHTTTLPGHYTSAKGGIIIQEILNRKVDKTAGIQFLLSGNRDIVGGIHNYVLKSKDMSGGLAIIPDEHIIEGVKYLKQYKGLKPFIGKYETPVEDRVSELIQIFIDEDWYKLDCLFTKQSIPEFNQACAKGYVPRAALNKMLLKEVGGALKKQVTAKIKEHLENTKPRYEYRVSTDSMYDGMSRACICYGHFPSLVQYILDKKYKAMEL